MAKKKAEPEKTSAGPRPNGIVIRGSTEWREWLREVADHDRTSVADMLDRAAVDYARKIGVKRAAPRR